MSNRKQTSRTRGSVRDRDEEPRYKQAADQDARRRPNQEDQALMEDSTQQAAEEEED